MVVFQTVAVVTVLRRVVVTVLIPKAGVVDDVTVLLHVIVLVVVA
jgi:hypothetical protein